MVEIDASSRYTAYNPVTPTSPIIAGVGLELGSRMQMDQLNTEIRRIGDLIERMKQTAIEHKLEHILDRVDRAERRPASSRPLDLTSGAGFLVFLRAELSPPRQVARA